MYIEDYEILEKFQQSKYLNTRNIFRTILNLKHKSDIN